MGAELLVTLCYNDATGRLTVGIDKGSRLRVEDKICGSAALTGHVARVHRLPLQTRR